MGRKFWKGEGSSLSRYLCLFRRFFGRLVGRGSVVFGDGLF